MSTPASTPFDQFLLEPAARARGLEPSLCLRALRWRAQVVDFVCEYACESAAQLLHSSTVELPGKRLCELGAIGPPGQPELVDCYRRILEQGQAQSFDHVHWVDGRREVVIHRVVRAGDGVAVTLTNLSANRRAQVVRLQEAAMHSRFNPVTAP